MNKDQLTRYSRHLLLPEVGVEGQELLLRSRALIIGLGGLGSPAAIYLASSGVGHLTLCDDDAVEASNLQRQILHGAADIGRPKTDSARDRLLSLNPQLGLDLISTRLEGQALHSAVQRAHVVIDASDNYATRYAVNAACVAQQRPLISGAAIRLEGQVAVFRPDLPGQPCYACLYPHSDEATETCAQHGVLAPLVGIIGCIQATEAIKVLLGLGESLTGRLLTLDAATMTWRSLRLRADPACPVCQPA